MGNTEKFTAEQVKKAIISSRGILSTAAASLKCSRSTVRNYIDRYPTVAAVYEDVNESNIDFVEGKLMQNINNNDVTSILFFLKTKGKHRGYVERQEIDQNNTGEVMFRVAYD